MNKIRITTHRYAYMGLAYDTVIEIACKLKGEYKNDVCFNHNGKQWTLSEGQGDFEYVDEEKIGVDTVEGFTEDNVVDEKEPTLHNLYITPKDIGVFHKDVVNNPSHYNLFDASLEKRKNGKLKAELLETGFPNAMMALAEVMTWAADYKGYLPNDWKNIPDAKNSFLAAAARHRLKRLKGEESDDESKLPHLYHEAFNVMAQLELLITGKL